MAKLISVLAAYLFVAVMLVLLTFGMGQLLHSAASEWFVVKVSSNRVVAGPFVFKSDCDDVAEYFEERTGWMHSCRML